MFLETEKLLDEKAILVFLFLINYTQHSCCLLFIFCKKKKETYIYICIYIAFFVSIYLFFFLWEGAFKDVYMEYFTKQDTVHPSSSI